MMSSSIKASPSRPAASNGLAKARKPLPGEEAVMLLLQHVCRTFYDTEHAILVDSLRRKKSVMRDDDLAGMMLMQKKDVAAVAKRLIEDQLLSSHMRREVVEGATKGFSYKRKGEAFGKGQKFAKDDGPRMQNKTYYFVDPSKATDNVKWRLYQIRKVLDDQDRNELDAQGYFCPLCKAEYTHLDAAELLDMARNVLACSVCGTEVVDKETIIESRSARGKMQKFTEQTKTMSELLRNIEEGVLPKFDIEQWLTAKDAEKARSAGGDAAAEAARVAALNVQLAGDEDEEMERQRREADAEEKRQQNQLPSWIAKSTVTGEAREVDDRARGSGQEEKTNAAIAEEAAAQDEQDDLDAYYARMASAHHDEPAASLSPISRPAVVEALAASGQSPLFSPITTPSARKEEDDEEDGELDDMTAALNEDFANGSDMSRTGSGLGDKRSRAESDDRPTPDDGTKRVKMEVDSPAHDVAGPIDEEDEDDDDDSDEFGDPNPMIAVGDMMIPFNEITDAHTEAMTPEEYTVYFDHYSRLG